MVIVSVDDELQAPERRVLVAVGGRLMSSRPATSAMKSREPKVNLWLNVYTPDQV
jgi:hypothetical protein